MEKFLFIELGKKLRLTWLYGDEKRAWDPFDRENISWGCQTYLACFTWVRGNAQEFNEILRERISEQISPYWLPKLLIIFDYEKVKGSFRLNLIKNTDHRRQKPRILGLNCSFWLDMFLWYYSSISGFSLLDRSQEVDYGGTSAVCWRSTDSHSEPILVYWDWVSAYWRFRLDKLRLKMFNFGNGALENVEGAVSEELVVTSEQIASLLVQVERSKRALRIWLKVD